MELLDQIRKISFIFFLILGLAHFLAGLMYINGYYIPASGIVNRVFFIPFVLAAITYGFSNLKYRMLELGKDSKALTYTFIAFGIVIFLVLLAIELFVIDSPAPLTPLS